MQRTILAGAAFATCSVVGMASSVFAGTVSGTAAYLERIAVPPEAVLEVKLVDVSRADAAAIVMSSQRYALKGVPQSFELSYDDALIDDRMRYNVEASVTLDGKLLFRSTQAYPVLTLGNSNTVEVVMQKIPSSPVTPTASLSDTQWQAYEMGGRMLIADKKPVLNFVGSDRMAFNAGCNQFNGPVEISAQGSMHFPGPMAGTMMACPAPYDKLEKTFAELLTQVTGYVVTGENLALTNEAGVTVMRLGPVVE